MYEGRGSSVIELAREVAESVPTEAELTEEVQSLNSRILDLNAEAGKVEAERRSVQHRLREVSKLLQAIQAVRVKGELSSLGGSGPREEWGRRPRGW